MLQLCFALLVCVLLDKKGLSCRFCHLAIDYLIRMRLHGLRQLVDDKFFAGCQQLQLGRFLIHQKSVGVSREKFPTVDLCCGWRGFSLSTLVFLHAQNQRIYDIRGQLGYQYAKYCHALPSQSFTLPGLAWPGLALPYHTIPYHTIPYHTIPYHTIPYTLPCHTIYHTIYLAMPYHIPYHTFNNEIDSTKLT